MSTGMRLRCFLAVVFAVAALGGCATRLSVANQAASSNLQALTAANPVYESALQARIDASSTGFWGRPGEFRPSEAALRQRSQVDLEYRTSILALKDHAGALARYFTLLSEYTAPGANSATTHTDAQLAAANGVVTGLVQSNAAIKNLQIGGQSIAQIAPALLRFALDGIADARLRTHLDSAGLTVAEGLTIQQSALTLVAQQLTENRAAICEGARGTFERAAGATRRPQGAAPFAPTDGQQFNDRRRAILMCNSEAGDAASVAAALGRSRQAYIDLLAGRLSPEQAALAMAETARALELARTLLN